MRVMKDSGIPWIGEIPEGWKVCFIKQIMRNKSIKGFPNERVLSLYRDYGVIPKDSRDDNHNVTSDDTSSYKLVDEGDFVINKMKAWQGSMAVSEYRGIISPAYYICRFTSTDINKRYIHYLLRNDSYKTEYMRLSSGLRVGQWDLNIDDFLRIMMILPPLAEQQRIAEFLDRKCAEVDEMIALQEQIIEELKAYKQSVITEAVTKGLNTDAPMRDSGIEWIGSIPEHWACKELKFAIEGLCDGTHGTFERVDNGELLLSAKNIGDRGIEIGDNESRISYNDYCKIVGNGYPQKGDVLLCCVGSIGKCCLFTETKPIAFQRSVAFLRKNKTMTSEYLMYLLKSNIMQAQYEMHARKSAQSGIYMGVIRDFVIVSPEIAEQQAIADYLDEKCADIDSLIQTKQSKIDSLKEYKKSIIYEYVTGKREVEL